MAANKYNKGGERMHCKYCGELNDGRGSYCVNCGKKIRNIQSREIKGVSETKLAFCKKCGGAITDRYCMSCGTSGYALELRQGVKFKAPDININKDAIDSMKKKVASMPVDDMKNVIKDKATVENVKDYVKTNADFKKATIAAAKMVGIGLLISLVIFFAISSTEPVSYLFQSIEETASYTDPQMEKIKPNFIDLFSTSVMSPSRIAVSFKGEGIDVDANSTINFKFLGLILIPLIAVFIGQLDRFKDKNSTKENLPFYALSSIIFSVVLGIISLINTSSIKIVDEYSDSAFRLRLGTGNFLSIISVFMLIFLMQAVISALVKKDNPFAILNNDKLGNLGDNMLSYVKSMSVFALAVSIALVLSIVVLGMEFDLEPGMIMLAGLVMTPMLFIQAWLYSFGYSLNTEMLGQSPYKLSIWKTFSGASEMGDYISGPGPGLAMVIVLLMLLGVAFVLFRVVNNIEKDNDFFLKLGALAGSISIFNILLSFLVGFSLKLKNNTSASSYYNLGDILYEFDLGMLMPLTGSGSLSQSYGIISIIIVTFLWVFAIGGLVFFLSNKDEFVKVTSAIDTKMKFIIPVYALILAVSFNTAVKEFMFEIPGMVINMFPIFGMLEYFL